MNKDASYPIIWKKKKKTKNNRTVLAVRNGLIQWMLPICMMMLMLMPWRQCTLMKCMYVNFLHYIFHHVFHSSIWIHLKEPSALNRQYCCSYCVHLSFYNSVPDCVCVCTFEMELSVRVCLSKRLLMHRHCRHRHKNQIKNRIRSGMDTFLQALVYVNQSMCVTFCCLQPFASACRFDSFACLYFWSNQLWKKTMKKIDGKGENRKKFCAIVCVNAYFHSIL